MIRRILAAALATVVAGLGLSGTALAADGNDPSTVIVVGGVSVDLCLVVGNETSVLRYVNNHNGSASDVGLSDVVSVLGPLNLDTRRQGCHGTGHHPPAGTVFDNCRDYHAHGIYDIPRTDPRYRNVLDANRNGLACERDEHGSPAPPPGVVVVGDCNNLAITLNNDGIAYRRAVDSYNHYLHATYQRDRSRANLDRLNTLYGQHVSARDTFNHDRARTVVVCHNTTAPTINYTVEQSPAQACGCVAGHGNQVVRVPSGSAPSGDGSYDPRGEWLSALGWGGLAVLLGGGGFLVAHLRRRTG